MLTAHAKPLAGPLGLLLFALGLVLILAPLRAHGGRAYAGIRRPEQLTVGITDEFLGQLAPDGKTLFFLSDRNILHEVYEQDLEAARAVLVFDEGADVTWVRVSPDGRHLLYISFRDEAAGQLCIRELRAGSHGEVTAPGGRRCLDDGSRPVQAQWQSASEIILLSRASLQGDLRISRVHVGPTLLAQPILDRNLTSPAVSPDGRWLVYVPVERFIEGVGPGFAARATTHLEAVRIDRPGVPAAGQPLTLDLPGQTSQPAFSPDGRSLYFVQFINDTNRDDNLDASDHGVLFRVPFDSARDDAPRRAAQAFPEQLTDAAWNCQYPSPAATHLITTCAHGNNLDVYGMPPEGVVPADWDSERLRLEIELSTHRSDLLLLYRHLLQREKDPARRYLDMTRLTMLHLELEEFHAAEFYAHKIDAERGNPILAGLGPVLLTYVEHRWAVSRHERGRAVSSHDDLRTRLATLLPDDADDDDEEDDESTSSNSPLPLAALPSPSLSRERERGRSVPSPQPTVPTTSAETAEPPGPAALALRQIVRSEITDALGDKAGARRELVAAALDAVPVPAVLAAYYDRADALYRELDDPAALYAVGKKLSMHARLLPEERLRYARAAVRALCRGRATDEALRRIARERAAAPASSELAFALTLAQAVLAIRDSHPSAATQSTLLTLYRQQTRPERRHAVMMDAGERATEKGADTVVETLVQIYVDDVPTGTRERQRAERLYQRSLESRAYRERATGQLTAARDDFARVARVTGSLESTVEYIDLRLREGATPAAIATEYEAPGAHHSAAMAHFVRAYLLALTLPQLPTTEQHEAAVQRALELLRKAWHALHGEPTARVLFGAILHEEFLRTGDLAAAQRADIHYLVAFNMLAQNPRYRALVLEQLGLLQAQAGNYRIALGYLVDREQLPFPEPAARLVHYLVKAQTLAHLDHDGEAAKSADAALAACTAAPELAAYRPLVLDRTALYNLAAGQFKRALELYDAELPLIQSAPGLLGERNRLVVGLAHAAAALGAAEPERALRDLTQVEGKLNDPRLGEVLKWPHTPAPESLRTYRIIAAGLRARAHRGTGQLTAAATALTAQIKLLQARQRETKVDEHLRPLALAEGQLAELLQSQGDAAAAGQWLRRALTHAAEFVQRTKIPGSHDQLALLWLATELQLSSQGHLGADFSAELTAAHNKLVQVPPGPLRDFAHFLEIYIPIASP